MGKTRGVHETTPELRNRMVGMYEAGLGLRDIAAAVNCSQRTVKRWLNRFDKEGTVETRERCGRKRATTEEEDDAIIRLATQTPITAAKTVLPALGLSCSVDTIRERLHKAGIHNWSPSKKHMQKITLGDGERTTVQQAVWRPTGTQLGKKKLGVKDTSAKTKKKGGSMAKKKQRSEKVRARDPYEGDGAPAEVLKQSELVEHSELVEQSEISSEIVFLGHTVTQGQQPASLPRVNDVMQDHRSALTNGQTEFTDPPCLVQPPQPQMYQHHPGLNVVQNWPLDLVQGSHHYPQGQPHPMSHDQPPPQQQLQELHTQREQEHRAHQQGQDHQRQMEQEQQLQSHRHNNHEQQQSHDHRMDHEIQQQPPRQMSSQPKPSTTRRPIRIVRLDSCSNSVSSNDRMSEDEDDDEDTSKDDSKDDCEDSSINDGRKKKKGGKAKGTLETSVEMRNRMIGMSEAGLSTLSIALAINRSERTVKRWLERWNKEGNVQTKERKGRRRITTKEQDEAIIAMATQNPLTAAKHVAPALGLNCSVDTIRERLHKAGIHSWKLGKKQGEGNAVHTVHLWQPSGNRPNKPKLPSEKRKKLSIGKKRVLQCGDDPKRVVRKKKIIDDADPKNDAGPVNIIFDPNAMQFHENANLSNYVSGPEMMQQVHNLPSQQTSLVQPSAVGAQPTTAMQAMGPLMQQRPDCRLAPSIVPPVPGQSNPSVAYTSCMVPGNSHANHMEQQPDPLNYEPYIWSF